MSRLLFRALVYSISRSYHAVDDLQSLDPDLYHGLVYLKNHTGDVADLSLTFAVDEDGETQY